MKRDSEHEAYREGRPVLSRMEILRLIWETYKVSAPYLFVYLLLFSLAIWLVTEVLFR